MKVAVIGGGAAGFFAAITAKSNYPNAEVVLLEKSQKLLAKVRISGGGRCNVTNGETSIKNLTQAYPRGGKALKKAFQEFSTQDTQDWFRKRGVKLYTQPDSRVFPVSDHSQTIIDCLMNESEKLGVQISLGRQVKSIQVAGDQLRLSFAKSDEQTFSKVIIATGGSPKRSGLEWLEKLGHQIETPVPSLFTFNMPNESIVELMGLVAPQALVSIQGTKLKASGPLLVTHWGMSGPAILKLSAFGARVLHDMHYSFKTQVNWANEANQNKVSELFLKIIEQHPKKNISSIKTFNLPERLWLYILKRSNLPAHKKWSELGKKGLNKLVTTCTNDTYVVKGKTTFKEEFVTCGGISLESVNVKTMESKVCPNLYFAGEVLDIDGITGGYNFQAAWTTGFIAGQLR